MTQKLLPVGLLFSLGACKDKGGTSPRPTNSGPDTAATATFSLLADEVGDGVLLSGWSDGDEARMVGGALAAGPGMMVRYDQLTLCVESGITEQALWWIHGSAPGAWTAVGVAGTVIQERDGVRTRIDAPTDATLYGVWDTGDTLIVGGGDVDANTGEVWRWQDETWTALATDLPGVVFKVWEDWLVGVELTYQLEGDILVDRGAAGRLLTVRGRATDDVWAVGGVGNALVTHWDGSAWSEIDAAGIGQPLNGIWTVPDEDVWVTGNFGTMAVWDGAIWTMPDWPLTSHHFHGVWRHLDEVLFVGGNLFSQTDNFATIGRYSTQDEPLEPVPCD